MSVDPKIESWAGAIVSGGNLDSCTIGRGTTTVREALTEWDTGRMFFDTDLNNLYINTGTFGSPSWTGLISGGTTFGTGADGALIISSDTEISQGTKQYTDLTIDDTYTMSFNSAANAQIILCSGTCTINGTISCGGTDARGGDGGAGGSGGSGGAQKTSSGNNPGSNGSTPSPADQTPSTTGYNADGNGNGSASIGGNGASGIGVSGSNFGSGANGADSVVKNATTIPTSDFEFIPTLYTNPGPFGCGGAGGGGGGGGGSGQYSTVGRAGGNGGAGGAGGKGGGSLILLAKNLSFGTNGAINANGAVGNDGVNGADGTLVGGNAGGGGGQGGAGSGGNGGFICVITGSAISITGAGSISTRATVAGGASGQGGNVGLNGSGGGGSGGTNTAAAGSAGVLLNYIV